MKKIQTLFITIISLSVFSVNAQQSTNSGGGEASGSGGSASFTTGQIDYKYQESTSGSVSQGVQQAFIIENDTNNSVSEIDFSIKLKTFPNPTNDKLYLECEKLESLMFYNIIDINGKVVSTSNITEEKSTIYMSNLAASSYFLQIYSEKNLIKSFKIIKN